MRTSILKLATGAAVGAFMAFSPMLASANAILLATPENFDGRSQTSRLFLFGEANVTGAVSSMAGGFNMPFDLGPTGVTDIALPTANLITANSTIENKGFLIESPDPISAHWLSRASFTTDMTFLHDANSLSTDYYVMSIGGGFGQGSQFTLTAREDNTTVTITPSANLSTGQAANVPFNVTLNAGETVKYSANPGPDLTGSRVQADKAVALFGGHSCAQVPPGTTACDFLISQLPGVDNYATDFVVPEVGSNGAAGNLIRILASEDNTSVSVDGIVVATLNAGEFHEIDFFQGGVINADKPVLVGQYLKGVGQTGNGDPAFTFVPGTNQLLDEYVFSTPVGADTFALDTLTIAAPTVDLAS